MHAVKTVHILGFEVPAEGGKAYADGERIVAHLDAAPSDHWRATFQLVVEMLTGPIAGAKPTVLGASITAVPLPGRTALVVRQLKSIVDTTNTQAHLRAGKRDLPLP